MPEASSPIPTTAADRSDIAAPARRRRWWRWTVLLAVGLSLAAFVCSSLLVVRVPTRVIRKSDGRWVVESAWTEPFLFNSKVPHPRVPRRVDCFDELPDGTLVQPIRGGLADYPAWVRRTPWNRYRVVLSSEVNAAILDGDTSFVSGLMVYYWYRW